MNNSYQDSSLSPHERAENLLSIMTLEEKVGQMMQISYKNVGREKAIEWAKQYGAGSFLFAFGEDATELQEMALSNRLSIPIIFGIDAMHGYALLNGSTVFPTQLGMSCSWNKELIAKAGRVTAREVAADGLHWTFSPVLCIGRDLRWGRINETFGEDPYLIGELASAMIKGYQGDKLSDSGSILACAKHYLGYGESTGGKDAYDTEVTFRKVRELFLPPFKKVVEAGCTTIMTGYHSIDGIPMTINSKMLRDVLKDELGFEGFVVTDWNTVGSLMTKQKVSPTIEDAAVKALAAGNDMIMTTNDFYKATIQMVKCGKVDEKLVDGAVFRILKVKFALGLFETKKRSGYVSKDIINCTEHQEINMQLTRQSIVLLKNENETLPLHHKKLVKTIAVIGPNADNIQSQFGDWTFFTHPNTKHDTDPVLPISTYFTMFEGIRKLAQTKGIEVTYHKGCDIQDKNDVDIEGAVKIATHADVIIAVVGDHNGVNGEFKDRATLDLTGAQERLLHALRKIERPLVVVLVNGKPLSIPWIDKNADAVVETFNSGALGGKALAEMLFGEYNPCGKLTISFPYHSGQNPVYYNYLSGWHSPKYADLPTKEPLYAFGYGLSYTQYLYENVMLSQNIGTASDIIMVSVDVTNTGTYDGIEIVQLYVNDIYSTVMTPVKELKGYQRVFLKTGEKKSVIFELKICDLVIVTTDEKYVVEPGEFEIMVGPDSRDSSLLKAVFRVI